jgi:hypothetical protein
MSEVNTVDEKHEAILDWLDAIHKLQEETKLAIDNLTKDVVALKMNAALDPKQVKDLNDIKKRMDCVMAMTGTTPSLKVNGITKVTVEGAKQITKTKKTDDKPSYLKNITEYFKHMYSTDRETLLSREIITEELEMIVKEKKAEAIAKKKTDTDKARTLATNIYKELTDEKKKTLKALKEQHLKEWTQDKAQILKS